MRNARVSCIAYTNDMMSDKFVQQVLETSSEPLAASEDSHQLSLIPVVNRSGATMQAIKTYILTHELAPGAPLPTEVELCHELGVSRSSVREALRKLEALDIVSVHQGRGSFVGEMSLRPLVETLILRSSLTKSDVMHSLGEVVALRKFLDLGMAADVCDAFKGKEHPELRTLVTTMIDKASRSEPILEEDSAFHAGILEVTGNSVAKEMVSALWMVHQVVVPHLEQQLSLVATAKAHLDMLEAAEAGDRRHYRLAIKAHYKPLETMLAKHKNAQKQKD